MASFGKHIKKLRVDRGITQRTLAEEVGIDVTYLSKIENDRMPPPSHETIQKMAGVLETDADELLIRADKVPKDLKPIITRSKARPGFFRSMQDLTDEELERVKRFASDLRDKREES